ncbi:cation/multidrug efflux pump [Desulfocurvibacter africanus PCS]|uniref:Cation/multidrug efflux pump n=1 Tax=Desulfocurvibacter africanus PCS TaxID=1262666 RepID=M5PQE9_DESAF|nr:efflux RND transporter permease subunit [Desulfocurvibacter africanus]EMG36552.1 cation/multidrug efflux pump [Desulfocurvibacter africanus PCS]
MRDIARFSVRRPVFTAMATLIVLILGGVSLSRLPIDLMPDITYPTLSISTTYENASPQEIETLVTRPVEQALSAVPGVEEVTSVSSEGQSSVRVTFTWGTDLDAAANDVRDRLDRILSSLPEDVDRPVLRKFDLASFPVLILGASSRLDPVQMRRLLDDEVRYRIERVPGVAALDIWGGLEREIHVDLLPERIKALDISLDQIVTRIKNSNLTLPAGVVESGNHEISIRTPGEFASLDELRDTVVAERSGVTVRLRDVAEVQDSWQRVTRIVRVNGEPGVRLSVSKQSGTNTVEVAERVLAELERINEDIPQVRIVPIVDTSLYIKRSITNVASSTIYGGLFAVIVLLAFLRHVRSTLIVAAAIPISIVATFMLIYFGGFTLNLMTLGGLALGVGMLVDNAIVVLENIHRLHMQGRPPKSAAVYGAGEVAAAITASTLTTLVVFLPLVFVRGMAGVMFKQLAYVVSFSLICSLGVALTLVPMLASTIMVPSVPRSAQPGLLRKLASFLGRGFTRMENAYKGLLHSCLAHRWLTIGLALGLLAGSFAFVPLIGVEMMPQTDEGEVRINVEMEAGTRLSLLDETFAPIEAIVKRAVPEAESVITSLGGSGWRTSGSHLGEMRISLVPQKQRERSSEEIAQALRKELAQIPGATIRTRAGQGLFILRMGTSGGEQLQVEIRGYDLKIADSLAEQVKAMAERIPGVTDTQISRQSGSPERMIVVDRAKAESLGVRVSDVANALQTALSGTRASGYREAGDEFDILVRLKDAEFSDLRDILDLTVANAAGQAVVLRNLVTVQPSSGPVSIERQDQERIVTVSGNLSGRDMGSVIADMRAELATLPVPRGFNISFGGDFEEQQEVFGELAMGLILALVLVYMVMACLYESLRDPFVVMFSVPLAIVGVVLMLFLTRTTFNVQSFIGCIMLGGIIVNNAILLVDQTNQLRREEGFGLREAIEEAGRRRLRPILMTSLTTVFGLLPLALGLGEGGEAQAPMARAVIGGLTSSTLITLVFVPVMYSLISGNERRSLVEDELEKGGAAAVLVPEEVREN